jgi:hypothetical protein
MNINKCRFCSSLLTNTFVDLGVAPPCNQIITHNQFNKPEKVYPLHAYVCSDCFLVQVPNIVAREEVFNPEYSYFSSYSQSWLKHCKEYVDKVVERFNLGPQSNVCEIASNDGYLLQYFKERNIPCLGVEPTLNTARVAQMKGIDTIVNFFGIEVAQGIAAHFSRADLIIGNNVLAHVPDINDFVAGIGQLLSSKGVATLEFPVLSQLIEKNLWDTIYHEHFSYLSFITVCDIFGAHGMVIFDVEELSTHGGSIRIYARRAEDISKPVNQSVHDMTFAEEALGQDRMSYYNSFASRVKESKRSILEWLIDAKRAGRTVVGFGAPGKGNTLLNYCGVGTDLIDFVVDDSPHKQGHYLPGSRIPILSPSSIYEAKPDYVVIMPWNLKDEIAPKLSYVKDWGGQLVVFLPEVRVL